VHTGDELLSYEEYGHLQVKEKLKIYFSTIYIPYPGIFGGLTLILKIIYITNVVSFLVPPPRSYTF
jgi:hypothetical protein